MESDEPTTSKPIDRAELYEEVWSDPVTVVAARYGLSDVGLAKICKRWQIPLPSRGYWAKVKAGRVMARVALLPLSKPPDIPVSIKKISGAEQVQKAGKRKTASDIRRTIAQENSEPESTERHPLVLAAEKCLSKANPSPKGLLSAPEEVLHLEVTQSSLDRALNLADALLRELGKLGVSVRINGPRKETVLCYNDTAVILTITEHVARQRHVETPAEKKARDRYYERRRFDVSLAYPHVPQYDYLPSGKLTISAGRWPSRTWRDTPNTPLEERLPEVVAGIITLAADTREHEDELARAKELRQQAQDRYEFLIQRRKSEAQAVEALDRDSLNFERANRIRTYLTAVRENAERSGGLSEDQLEWLKWAAAKADWIDPLIDVADIILDAPEPKRPGYW